MILVLIAANGRATEPAALESAPAPGPRPASRPAPPARAANPHFNPDGCASCHAVADGKALPISPAKVDATCLSCHDGVRAAEEPHASGVPANPAHADPGWPLVQGRLSCLTCHDVKQGCGANAAKKPTDRHQAKLLRSSPGAPVAPAGPARERPRDGPPKDPAITFCGNCHQPSSFARLNPHLTQDADRKPLQARCGFCHDKPMDAGAMARTGQASLRKPETALCGSCHSPHPDPAPKGHMGSVVSADQQAYMRAREIVGLLNSPAKRLVSQLQQQKAKPTFMPLAQGSTVGCSTCHNPHQSGTFPPASVLAFRTMRVIDGKTISPVRTDNWCRHCHEF